jgi:hypothetical protein
MNRTKMRAGLAGIAVMVMMVVGSQGLAGAVSKNTDAGTGGEGWINSEKACCGSNCVSDAEANLVRSTMASSAFCYPGGGVTMSHGVVGPVEAVNGAIRWNHDNELWMLATVPCIVRYVGDIQPIATPSHSVTCWSDGNVIYNESGSGIRVEDGVLQWVETVSGLDVMATVGCEVQY